MEFVMLANFSLVMLAEASIFHTDVMLANLLFVMLAKASIFHTGVMLANFSLVMLAKASIFYTGVLLFSPAISLTSFGTRYPGRRLRISSISARAFSSLTSKCATPFAWSSWCR